MSAIAKAKKAQRIVKVHNQMHRAARSTLVRLERELDQAEMAQQKIAEAIGTGEYPEGLTDLAIVRLRSLSREGRRLLRERDRQQEAVAEQEARLKGAEKSASQAETAARFETEAAALQDLLERYNLPDPVRSA